MSTPDDELSGRGLLQALKARGIGINENGKSLGFMPKSLVLYQDIIGTLHENNGISSGD